MKWPKGQVCLFRSHKTARGSYNWAMHFDSQIVQTLFYILAIVAAVVLLFIGYYGGRSLARIGHRRLLATREKELFTAQKGFKNLYEQEVATLKTENDQLKLQIEDLNQRVEDY